MSANQYLRFNQKVSGVFQYAVRAVLDILPVVILVAILYFR